MKIFYTEEFRRDIKKMREKNILDRLKKVIDNLKENPEASKPLKYSLAGLRSLKLNKFRIIYKIEEDKNNSIKIWT